MDDKRRGKGKVSGFYLPILKGIHGLGVKARNGGMVRPTAITLSFAFTDEYLDYPISGVIDRIRVTFIREKKGRKRASTFKLKYLWVRETKYLTPKDPEFESSLSRMEKEAYLASISDGCPLPYPHYHMVLMLDAHKGSWRAVQVVMRRLVEEGIVRAGFHFSENNNSRKKEVYLKNDEGFRDYMYRASYLAKTDTKDLTEKRLWSMSQ